MKIICINPGNDPLWQRLLEQHNSDAFHSPAWIRALTHTYEFDIRALIVVDDEGDPKAGITYCKIEDMLNPRIISLPFSDFCDPLVEGSDDWRCLIDQLLAYECRVALRCLHNGLPLNDDRFTLVNRAKWHKVDLQPDLDTIWESLDGSAKRAITKAQREGVVVRVAEQKEELRAFFNLHLRLRKYKYQLLAQPYNFFENIWNHFIEKQNGALMVALYQGEIIGGVMFLEWQNKLYYKFNASNPALVSLRPNDLVIWEGVKYGKSKGYFYLDFGLSDWDQEGLLRYKRKFATEEKTISLLRHEPKGTPVYNEKEIRSLLPQLTDLFVNGAVPDTVTEKAGEILYRFFT